MANQGLPQGLLLNAVNPSPPDSFVQHIAQLMHSVFPPVQTTGYSLAPRAVSIKDELDDMNMVLNPMLIGMLRNGVDYINLKGIQIIITNQTNFQQDSFEMITALPGPVPSMGSAQMIRTRETTRQARSGKWDLSFMMDGEVARTPQGVKLVALKMAYITNAMSLHSAMQTVGALVSAGLEKRPGSLQRYHTVESFEAEQMELNMVRASPYKSILGFNAHILDRIRYVFDTAQELPDMGLIPREKESVFLHNPQMVSYRRGGKTAEEKFWRDENILGDLHGIRFMTTPQPPGTAQNSFQLNRLIVAGNYARIYPRDDQTKAVWKLYNTTLDGRDGLSAAHFVSKAPFYEEFDFKTPAKQGTFALAMLTAFEAIDQSVTPTLNNIGDLFWNDRHNWQDIFDDWNVYVNGQGFANAVNGRFDAGEMDRFITTKTPETLRQLHASDAFSEFLGTDFNDRGCQVLQAIWNLPAGQWTDDRKIGLLKLFAELVAANQEFIQGITNSRFLATQRAAFKNGGNIIHDLLVQMNDNRAQQYASICNLQALRDRSVSFAHAMTGNTPFTTLKPTKRIIPKMMVFSESSFFKSYQFGYLRLWERQNMLAVVLFVSGINTGFLAMSAPVLSTTEDAVSFINYYHVSKRSCAFIRDVRRVLTLPDQLYNGYVSGGSTGIMSLAEMDRYMHNGFLAKSASDNSAILIITEKDQFEAGQFINVTGRIEGSSVRPNPAYPHLDFWKDTWCLNNAMTTIPEGDDYRSSTANVCFRTTVEYPGPNGIPVVEPGQTYHGKYGEQPGAKVIRMLGKDLYPHAADGQ